MDLQGIIRRNKKLIILAALALGALHIFDMLPPDLLTLGENTKYAYLAVLALAAYAAFSDKGSPQIKRTVPIRDLSNKTFHGDLYKQRGQSQQPIRRQQPTQQPIKDVNQPNEKWLKEFDKEE